MTDHDRFLAFNEPGEWLPTDEPTVLCAQCGKDITGDGYTVYLSTHNSLPRCFCSDTCEAAYHEALAARIAEHRYQMSLKGPRTYDAGNVARGDSDRRGFTLIELMFVVAIIGLLAAIALPNLIEAQNRAKEACVKANMHNLQLDAEGYAVDHDGLYAPQAGYVVGVLSHGAADAPDEDNPDGNSNINNTYNPTFPNPFTHQEGNGKSWLDAPTAATLPSIVGIVTYADDGGMAYTIRGCGSRGPLPLVIQGGDLAPLLGASNVVGAGPGGTISNVPPVGLMGAQ